MLEGAATDSSASDARKVDNRAGCVARLARRRPEGVLLARTLQAMVGVMALREDFEEDARVWGLVVAMYREAGDEARAALGPLTERVMGATEEVPGEAKEQLPNEETREEVLQLVLFVRSKRPGLVDARPGLVTALAGRGGRISCVSLSKTVRYVCTNLLLLRRWMPAE